jgi:amino acid permease
MEDKINVEEVKKEALKKQDEEIKKIEEEKLKRTGYEYKLLLKQKNKVFYIAVLVLVLIELAILFSFMFLSNLSDFKIFAEIIIPILWAFEFLSIQIYTTPNKKIINLTDLEAGKEKQRLDKEEEENIRKRNKNRFKD